jgi:hypothetical protein
VRIRHKTHLPKEAKPVELDPEYQAEVDRSTTKLMQRYQAAQRSAERAQEKLQIARARRARKAELRELEQAVQARLAELAALERMMTSSPAGTRSRGTEGWRKVPL